MAEIWPYQSPYKASQARKIREQLSLSKKTGFFFTLNFIYKKRNIGQWCMLGTIG